jgi:hypothetical protein
MRNKHPNRTSLLSRRELVSFAVAVVVTNDGRLSAAKSATQNLADAPPKFPDATTTGVPAGTVLTDSGSITTTVSGQVISARNITNGSVTINHNNCILEKSKVKGGAFFTVNVKQGVTGTIVQDCEIDSNGVGGSCGINGTGTLLRNNIHDTENGINLNGPGPNVIEDNYIHDLRAGGSPHFDGIQIDGGVNDTVIRHNTVLNPANQVSAVMIDNYWGAIDDILVENNYLAGGVFTVYCSAQFRTNAPVTNVRFVSNRMGKGTGGYTAFTRTSPVWQRNYDAVTGRPI